MCACTWASSVEFSKIYVPFIRTQENFSNNGDFFGKRTDVFVTYDPQYVALLSNNIPSMFSSSERCK